MTLLLISATVGAVGIGLATALTVSNKNERRIHFVEDNDFSDELDDLDIEVSGSEECMVCGDELESEDVGAVVRKEGEYRAVCGKRTCLDTYDLE